MKKKNLNSVFLVLTLLLCICFKASGQDQDRSWYNNLFKLLKLDQSRKIDDGRRPKGFAEKESLRRLAIENINKFIEEQLRAIGYVQ